MELSTSGYHKMDQNGWFMRETPMTKEDDWGWGWPYDLGKHQTGCIPTTWTQRWFLVGLALRLCPNWFGTRIPASSLVPPGSIWSAWGSHRVDLNSMQGPLDSATVGCWIVLGHFLSSGSPGPMTPGLMTSSPGPMGELCSLSFPYKHIGTVHTLAKTVMVVVDHGVMWLNSGIGWNQFHFLAAHNKHGIGTQNSTFQHSCCLLWKFDEMCRVQLFRWNDFHWVLYSYLTIYKLLMLTLNTWHHLTRHVDVS